MEVTDSDMLECLSLSVTFAPVLGLQAKVEPTQVEPLMVIHYKGGLLVLLANIRLTD